MDYLTPIFADSTICHNSTGWPQKSKPLPNYQKIVLNRIEVFHRD